MWTEENRQRYNRDKLRYPSDLTNEEWALLKRLIPRAKRGGRKRGVDIREVANSAMYVLSTGCQWRALPKDLPPRSTVHDYLKHWEYDGTLHNMHHTLYQKCHEQGEAIVHAADIQDRDGGVLALSTMFGHYPFLTKVFADDGYQGAKFRQALKTVLPGSSVEIVKRSDTAKGFKVLPRRWVVERTFAWLNRYRRLAKDFENLHRSALALIRLASIRLMIRKLCNSKD